NETVFFVPSLGVGDEHGFAHRNSGRKLMNDLLSGGQVVASQRFKCTCLRFFSWSGIAQPDVAVSGFAAKIGIVDTAKFTGLVVDCLVFYRVRVGMNDDSV